VAKTTESFAYADLNLARIMTVGYVRAIRHLTYTACKRTIRVAGQRGEKRISTYRYTRTDFDRVLQFVRGLYEPRTPEVLSQHLVSALLVLVPATFVASGSVQSGATQQARALRSDPPEFATPQFNAIVTRYLPENPMFALYQRKCSVQFTRWSDLQPFSQFQRTAVYNEAYRHAGVRDWCTLFSYCGTDRLDGVGIGLHKQFPDAHRDILVSISPHLLQAFRLAHTSSALIEMAAMKTGANCLERGLVAIDLDGTVTMETPAATRSLEKFFPKRTRRGLPDQLALWISRSDENLRKGTDVPDVRRPLVVERGGNRLTVHLLSKLEQNFLVLEEHRWAIDPASLKALPLTHRESEILAYVAVGKTNPEIAIILRISSRTVSKHMEHILDGLRVETRTAAAAMALEAANL
jgi:DNA-binding CsgD family transcriptional regulator